jgi:hypothetical protein
MGADTLGVEHADPEYVAGISDHLPPVAATLARRYGTWVEYDDVLQELWVYALRNHEALWRLLEPEAPEGMGEVPKPVLRASWSRLGKRLSRAGERYCRREKARQSGYRVEDEYFYDTGLIEALLPVALDPSRDTSLVVTPDDNTRGRGKADPAEGNDLAALCADLQVAVRAIEPEHQAILVAIYGPVPLETHKERDTVPRSQSDVARVYGTTQQAVSRRHGRALRAIQRELGGQYPGID